MYGYSQPEHRQLPLKLMKRSGIYKASNVTFNPETCQAYSYDWWRFVDRIGGLVIFNSYGYSNSTRKHQYKVKRVMESLGIKVDFEVEAPKGLQDLDSALRHYEYKISKLLGELSNPRTRRSTNERRREELARCEQVLKLIRTLIKARAKHESEAA